LIAGLSSFFQTENVIWRGPEWLFPIYFWRFYQKAKTSDADIVHCDDAVTAIIGALIKRKTNKIVTATAHGLDVIFPHKWYQKKLISALNEIDHIICVSKATAEQVKQKGVSEDKISIINNSVNISNDIQVKHEALSKVKSLIGFDLSSKKILFSLGRPVRRKGFHKFITSALDKLDKSFIYIIAGPPPVIPGWLKFIKPIIGDKNYHLLLSASGADSVHEELENLSDNKRIFYLKRISLELKYLLFDISDLFIMPNIKVDGNMEGFGIVILEASVRGVPIVAFAVDGVTDAVIGGENGILITPEDYQEMVNAIKDLMSDNNKLKKFGEQAKEFTKNRFSDDIIHGEYVTLFNRLIK
jgi:glycosyltransferase involved in cell wall biosynthesis